MVMPAVLRSTPLDVQRAAVTTQDVGGREKWSRRGVNRPINRLRLFLLLYISSLATYNRTVPLELPVGFNTTYFSPLLHASVNISSSSRKLQPSRYTTFEHRHPSFRTLANDRYSQQPNRSPSFIWQDLSASFRCSRLIILLLIAIPATPSPEVRLTLSVSRT